MKYKNVKGHIGIIINDKLQTVLTKNKKFQIVYNILKILSGEDKNNGDLDIGTRIHLTSIHFCKKYLYAKLKIAQTSSLKILRNLQLYEAIFIFEANTKQFNSLNTYSLKI